MKNVIRAVVAEHTGGTLSHLEGAEGTEKANLPGEVVSKLSPQEPMTNSRNYK